MASIEITGLEEVKAKLSKLSESLTGEEMRHKMQTVGEILATVTEESFEEERSPFGAGWKPRKRDKKGQSTKILRESGNLADRWMVQATPTEVVLSNNMAAAYGAVHQFGSRKSSGRGSGIPARPFLPIDSSGRIEPSTGRSIVEYLSREIAKAAR